MFQSFFFIFLVRLLAIFIVHFMSWSGGYNGPAYFVLFAGLDPLVPASLTTEEESPVGGEC
jgi:hypothetical protein